MPNPHDSRVPSDEFRPLAWSRRAFLERAAAGLAAVGAGGLAVPAALHAAEGSGLGRGSGGFGGPPSRDSGFHGRQRLQERFPVVAEEPWGRILRLSEGVWALESTPLRDRTTLANGGIVAGRAGVVLVEAFGSPEGARWMAEEARRLTGRAPTHVVLTHHHGDHTAGLRALAEEYRVEVLVTRTALDRIPGRPGDPEGEVDAAFRIVGEGRPTELDLGDRSLLLVPRRGHTASDLTVEVFGASVVFCGDLVWNGMFPNYVDAIPSRLSQNVRVLRALGANTLVSGHGALADVRALEVYIGLLDHVEAAAREALREGWSSEEAGARYRLPPETEGWTLFNPGYFARAIGAWMRELEGATKL